MLPFDCWANTDAVTRGQDLASLERFFGPAAVVLDSYQVAFSCILEVLGSSSQPIPCILPITASPDTIAGVLRAGAEPVLLDIRAATLQMDPVVLREVLEAVGTAVVILTRPGGQPVDPELLELTKDQVTILDSRLIPHLAREKDCVCTFNVFDLGPVIGSGSVVIHKFSEQVNDLKMARSGLIGHSAALNDRLAAEAKKRLLLDPTLEERNAQAEQVVSAYKAHKLPYLFENSPEWPYFIIQVPKATAVQVNLAMHGIESVLMIAPLHQLEVMTPRWVEKPSYPVAEELSSHLLAIPTHNGTLERVDEIVEHIHEIIR